MAKKEGRAPDARTSAVYQPLPSRFTITAQRRHRSPAVSVRGAALDPMFNGRYFFDTLPAGTIGHASDCRQEGRAVVVLELPETRGGTTEVGLFRSFGVDEHAELYIVSYSRSRILKIIP